RTVEWKAPDDTLRMLSSTLADRAWPGRGAEEMPRETQDLRKAGLKVTHPRMRILEILEASDGKHMTAEDISRNLLDHHDDIGLATVYRVLTQFESAGLVLKHNFE